MEVDVTWIYSDCLQVRLCTLGGIIFLISFLGFGVHFMRGKGH